MALRRADMYASYISACQLWNRLVLSQSQFSVLVRDAYPHVRCVTGSSIGRTVYFTGITSNVSAVCFRFVALRH